MSGSKRNFVRDLRAANALTLEAIHGIAGIVETMQRAQTEALGPLARPVSSIHAGVRKITFGTFHGVTQLVGQVIDGALTPLEPIAGAHTSARWLDAALAVLNGVVGDHLERTGSPLAIDMELRCRGRPLTVEPEALAKAMPDATRRLLVLVHGSCLGDEQWRQAGHDHGESLASDLGCTAVYVRYNSGRHISTNGAELARLLERLVHAWPTPIEALALVGHSMGGLVARAACHTGEALDHRWRAELGKLVCLGTPNLGAPYERMGNWVDVALALSPRSAPLARLGKIRSAGITDLRFGFVSDDDWKHRDRFARGTPAGWVPLPAGVECYALAASLAAASEPKPRDDGLVPVDSALGRGDEPKRTLGFAPDRQAIAFETGHLALLSSPKVYQILRSWLDPEALH